MTIKEIARHTGLSVPTIGNVLGRSGGRYSAETRAKVIKAARELGYRPNSSARAMRQGRIGCAALVLSRSHQQTHSYIPPGLLDGLDDELALHNMHLTISRLTDEELSTESFLPKVLREYMADGMIVNYTHAIPQAMLELIHTHRTPAVWLNAKLREDCVYPDDVAAARRATAELIELGHRRITLLHMISGNVFAGGFEESRPLMHYSVADRADGYEKAMVDAGLSPRIAHQNRFIDGGEQVAACRALLSGPDRPTAVLVYSDLDVSLVMSVAAELGLSVPRDLSVLVFYPVSPWVAGKSVSAVRIPTAEMGRRAVRMLLKKIEAPNVSCAPERVPYEVVLGETVAPPRLGD
ncbi:MAG: LacI family DNA-binding transcriptional regulator [Tepidisphaeraceae bacterium]